MGQFLVCPKAYVNYLSCGIRISAELSFVLSQFTLWQTDGLTDRQTRLRSERPPAYMQRGKNDRIHRCIEATPTGAIANCQTFYIFLLTSSWSTDLPLGFLGYSAVIQKKRITCSRYIVRCKNLTHTSTPCRGSQDRVFHQRSGVDLSVIFPLTISKKIPDCCSFVVSQSRILCWLDVLEKDGDSNTALLVTLRFSRLCQPHIGGNSSVLFGRSIRARAIKLNGSLGVPRIDFIFRFVLAWLYVMYSAATARNKE